MKVIWSAPAEADLDALTRYIAATNVLAALSQEERIREAIGALSRYPRIGRLGRRSGWRELVVPGTPYIAMYRVVGREVQVMRIVHGAQAWPPEIPE